MRRIWGDPCGQLVRAAGQHESRNVTNHGTHEGSHFILPCGIGGQERSLQNTGSGVCNRGRRYFIDSALLQKADGGQGDGLVDLLPFLAAPGGSPGSKGAVSLLADERLVAVDDLGTKILLPQSGMGSFSHATAG